MTTRGAIEQALAHLLPQGHAWPRDPNSVWMRLLQGIAAPLAEVHDWTHLTAREWLPSATRTRIGEWEAATGLPNTCFGPLQTLEERRGALLARLRGWQGEYSDSSPAALGGLQRFIDTLGVPVTLHYNTPFRVGRDRVGARMGTNDGRLHAVVAASASRPFRVSVGRTGRRLIERPAELAQVACALDAVVPARFEINVTSEA